MKTLAFWLIFVLALVGFRAWNWYTMPDSFSSPWSEPTCVDGHCLQARVVTAPRPSFADYMLVGRQADDLQLNPQDAALRALAYDMQRCGFRRANISAMLKFYLPGGDAAIQRFWSRVDSDTHRPWFPCEVHMVNRTQ